MLFSFNRVGFIGVFVPIIIVFVLVSIIFVVVVVFVPSFYYLNVFY